MSTEAELQAEEREALESIYEGDTAFKEVDGTTYQYKYGVEDDIRSFLVELKWIEKYPNELPLINMDTFYNRHLMDSVKIKIQDALTEEGQNWLGCGMTYTLFECLKDRLDELTAGQSEAGKTVSDVDKICNAATALKISECVDASKKKEPKKEQRTKAQKRRQWERTDHKGDHPRGWDWIDVVKHLSQTGGKDSGGGGGSAPSTTTNPNIM